MLRPHGRLLAAVTLFVGVLVGPASADDEWDVYWRNGTRVESKDGEVALRFGGRIQADFSFASVDNLVEETVGEFGNGFEFRRTRLFFEGTFSDRVKFRAQYDFAGGDALPKDLYVAFLTKHGDVRLGHFKEFFGLETLTSSNHIAFLERSLPMESFDEGRNAGIATHGSSGDRVNWGAGVFYDTDEFGEIVNDDRINVTGRVVFRPLYEDDGRRLVHVGLGLSDKGFEGDATVRFRSRAEAHFYGRLIGTPSIPIDGALIAGLELATVMNSFWAAAEYIRAETDSVLLGDPIVGGAYVQAGYFLTGESRGYKPSNGTFDRVKPNNPWDGSGGKGAWEIAARWSSLDLNDSMIAGGTQNNLTLAINWYPNSATRLMFNWVHAEADIPLVGRGLGGDFAIARVQVDF